MKPILLLLLGLWPIMTPAQVTLTISSPNGSGPKAVAPTALTNNVMVVRSSPVSVLELRRAPVLFGQTNRWIFGKGTNSPIVATVATNVSSSTLSLRRPKNLLNPSARTVFGHSLAGADNLAVSGEKAKAIQPLPVGVK